MLTIYGFSGYGMEPVEPISTFATVLHLPDSEEIWPGEWVHVFPQHYFATQHNDGNAVYLARGSVEEHMRYELLRMTKGAHFLEGRHEHLYTEHLAFHRWALNSNDFNWPNSPEKLPEVDLESFVLWSSGVELLVLDESLRHFLSPQFPAETNSLIEKEDK